MAAQVAGWLVKWVLCSENGRWLTVIYSSAQRSVEVIAALMHCWTEIGKWISFYLGDLLVWGPYATLSFQFCASDSIPLDSYLTFLNDAEVSCACTACAMQLSFQWYSFWRTPLASSQRELIILFRYVPDFNLSSNCASEGRGCSQSHGS